MSDIQSLLTIQNYGKIRIDLKRILDERGIKRNALARSIDVRFEVVKKWYDGDVAKLDLDVLARICYVLGCEPGDLLKREAH